MISNASSILSTKWICSVDETEFDSAKELREWALGFAEDFLQQLSYYDNGQIRDKEYRQGLNLAQWGTDDQIEQDWLWLLHRYQEAKYDLLRTLEESK